MEHALDVGVEGTVPVGLREGVDTAAHGDPRIVEKDVDVPIGLHHLLDGVTAALLAGDVTADGERTASSRPDLLAQGLQTLKTPGE